MTGFTPFMLTGLELAPWWRPLADLEAALAKGGAAQAAYAHLWRSLYAARQPDLYSACAAALLWREQPLARAFKPTESVRLAASYDLEQLLPRLRRDYAAEVAGVPPLSSLEFERDERLGDLAELLEKAKAEAVLKYLIQAYAAQGAGLAARFAALRWQNGELAGVAHPLRPALADLVDLERQLGQLSHNTERFLAGQGAQHALLYGPRGAGKSTAVRALLPPYEAQGLRLVELAPAELRDLPELAGRLWGRPQRFIVFVDDLSFEAGDASYQALKTLLEGSLEARPDNMLLYATSNRRHLVSEQFSDRPDPLNNDVHAWDTQNERLALADRFGLTVTFPGASQKRYLEIVAGLLSRRGLMLKNWRERAIRFADWGNGYSGRSARQFVESL